MSTGSTCHWTRSRFVSAIILSALLLVSAIILSALLLVMGSPPDPAAGEQDARNHGSATTIKGVVVDEKAQPQAGVLVRCSDLEDPPMNGVWPATVILGEAFSDTKGELTLPISPIAADKIWCWIDGGNVYE